VTTNEVWILEFRMPGPRGTWCVDPGSRPQLSREEAERTANSLSAVGPYRYRAVRYLPEEVAMTNGKGLFDQRVMALIRSEMSRVDLALRAVKAEDEAERLRAELLDQARRLAEVSTALAGRE
jgi:hypothetical protein